VLVALIPDGDVALGVVAFGLAGLGCSALLPLTISLGQKELTAVSAGVAGGVIAFYQVGYGLAAFGIGPLVDRGVTLSTVYKVAALIALAMGLWSFVVARGRTSPEALHPVPEHGVSPDRGGSSELGDVAAGP
jgi:predicted MFS family arabinose efflux permease